MVCFILNVRIYFPRCKNTANQDYVTAFLQTGLFLGFFSREIVHLRSARVRFGKVKQWRPYVHMST